MGTLGSDFATRCVNYARRPGFTLVAVITLGLGIGATAAIFSVVYGVLLRPLPYSDPNRIMAIFEVTTKGTLNRLADPNFDDFRDQTHSFQMMAKYSAYMSPVLGDAQPSRSMVAHVTPAFSRCFVCSRLSAATLTPPTPRKALHRLSSSATDTGSRLSDLSPDLSRLHLKIDGTDFSVIGVLPPGFQFPANTDLWVAADREGENQSRSSHNFDAVGRLKDSVL